MRFLFSTLNVCGWAFVWCYAAIHYILTHSSTITDCSLLGIIVGTAFVCSICIIKTQEFFDI